MRPNFYTWLLLAIALLLLPGCPAEDEVIATEKSTAPDKSLEDNADTQPCPYECIAEANDCSQGECVPMELNCEAMNGVSMDEYTCEVGICCFFGQAGDTDVESTDLQDTDLEPDTEQEDVSEETQPCNGPGHYESGKEGSYLPCCEGLTEVFQGKAGYIDDEPVCDGHAPLRVYACVEGTCGDGICEVGEDKPCGCVADCTAARWETKDIIVPSTDVPEALAVWAEGIHDFFSQAASGDVVLESNDQEQSVVACHTDIIGFYNAQYLDYFSHQDDIRVKDSLVTADGGIVVLGEADLTDETNILKLMKFNADRQKEWEVTLPVSDFHMPMTLTSSGNILHAGLFEEEITFGEGPSAVTLGVPDDDSKKIYLVEFTQDGVVSWAKEVDLNLNIYDIGVHEETGDILLLAIPDITSQEYFDSISVVTARFNATGDLIWLNDEFITSNSDDMLMGLLDSWGETWKIHILSDGSFFISGSFYDEIGIVDRFDNAVRVQAPVIDNIDYSTMPVTAYRAYFNAEGRLQWATSAYNDLYNATSEPDPTVYANARGNGMTLLHGNLLVEAGNAVGPVVFNPNTEAAVQVEDTGYIAAYDTEGNMAWIKTFDNDIFLPTLATTASNELLLAGIYEAPVSISLQETGEVLTFDPTGTAEEFGMLLAKIAE